MKAKVALVPGAREAHSLTAELRAATLARSTWYWHARIRMMYAEKHAHLEGPLKAIRRVAPGVRVPAGPRQNSGGRTGTA